ncbi:uncharacterized protein BDZ99DRAFT_470686 [Mytilinidion resinicola]|uniref:Piwi domain-containing protein n=1 Tax=Mytilinidion resinicola TaxID=574789 RepID=A0A6A6ZBM5_9PEZI|nr:uncharacterized protein BDZ99DRAFT_470686 [Mytilinidion resinicola]KAF2817715.1 hypothetical protein BDZ99DRAFT_470686 [Mytilinidion resinicola]
MSHSENATFQVGANKMFLKSGYEPLENGALLANRGYFVSARPAMGNIILNINTVMSAFYAPMLVSKFLKRYDDPDKAYDTIRGFGKTIQEQTFKKDGKDVTVKDYLNSPYPGLNLENAKESWMVAVDLDGGEGKESWYTPEKLLILPYQVFNRVLPSQITSDMITKACRAPAVTVSAIVGGLQALGISGKSFSKAFSVDPRMLEIPVRAMEKPNVQYRAGDNSNVEPGPKADLSEVFELAADIQSHRTADSTQGGDVNKRMLDPEYYDFTDLISKPARPAVHLVLLVLPKKDKDIYADFKKVADREGCHSICVTEQPNFMKDEYDEKGNPKLGNMTQYVANVTMKLNLKAGGVNHTVTGLTDSLKDTLVLGADLTHPSPGSVEGAPSIAALVRSVGTSGGKWLGSMRLQFGTKERKQEEMVRERIKAWQKDAKTDKLPAKVIYFRDGVSHTQYETIRQDEIRKIRSVCEGLGWKSTAAPKITAIIVTKRHHTRFFPKELKG